MLEDLRSLCRAVQAYEEREDSPTLTGFLEHARGLHARELTPGQDRRITVSTIHRAKGTEARVVILAGCEERLLPSWRVARDSRAAAGGTATVLRRLHASEGPAVRDARPDPRRARDRGPVAVSDRGRAAGGRAVSGERPAEARHAIASRFERDAWIAEQTRPLRAALGQTEHYTDLRGHRHPLDAMTAAEALLVLALLERHAETLHRGELGEPANPWRPDRDRGAP